MVAEPAVHDIVRAGGRPDGLRHLVQRLDMRGLRRLVQEIVVAATSMHGWSRLLAVAVVACAIPPRLAAQYVCRPGAESNAGQRRAILSVPLAFGPGGPPGDATGVTLGIEAARVPGVDPATATPTTCRPGQGPQT